LFDFFKEDMKKIIPIFIFVFLFVIFTNTAWTYSVPDTGQTQSYTDTFGEDSDYIINPPSYTKLDEEGNDLPESAAEWVMVRDNVTGLIWEVKTADGSIHDKENTYPITDFSDGQNEFTAELNAMQFGGFSDWRIPTIRELVSIANYGQFHSAINTNYFPNTVLTPYSSSTSVASVSGGAFIPWECHFSSGGFAHLLASHHYIRAVRGDTQEVPGFIDNGNGTITDKSTSLMWQKENADSLMDWNAAIAYCENMTLAGYDDWRLPTIKELNSIVDYALFNPAINSEIFPYTASDRYWSSTTSVFDKNKAWAINFKFGSSTFYDKEGFCNVRAVRVNERPTADAGPDQDVREGAIVTLDASNSTDLDDGIVSYFWEQIEGPHVNLVDPTTAQPTFTAPDVGREGTSLKFQLTVRDRANQESQDTCIVEVRFVNEVPVSQNQSFSTNEDSPLNIALIAGDPDGDPLIYSVESQPGHGTLTGTAPNLTYIPESNYNGSDSFTFKVNDGLADSSLATVSIIIKAVNDPPTISAIPDQSIDEDTATCAISFAIDDVDTPDSDLNVSGRSSNPKLVPDSSIVFGGSGANRTVTITPATNQFGTVTITVTVTDGTDGSAVTFTLSVNAVNDAPRAKDDCISTDEDTPFNINVLQNDTDVDGDTLSVTLDTVPSKGSVTDNGDGTLMYIPNANFNGTDSFSYTASDGHGGTDTATVTITVNPVNDTPVASDQVVDTDEDTLVNITLSATDIDGDPLTYALVSHPLHGSLSSTESYVTYKPNAAYYGSDSFTFKANDGTVDSNTATVIVNVTNIVIPGDIDDNGVTDLSDAILALQILNSIQPGVKVHKESDINGNGTIGLEEIIYVLREVSRLKYPKCTSRHNTTDTE